MKINKPDYFVFLRLVHLDFICVLFYDDHFAVR